MRVGAALLVGGLLTLAARADAQGDFLFDSIPGLDAEPTVEINLNPTMMGLFAEAAKGADGEAAAALSGVTDVRVRVYEGIGEHIEDVLKFVADTSTRLERDGWQTVVRVREDGEHVRIFVRPGSDTTIAGLTIMVADSAGDEAVFINVGGTIRPAQLGRLASQMGMSGVFDLVPGVPGAGAGRD